MQIQTGTLEFSGSRKITVSENDFDITRRLNRLTKEAREMVSEDAEHERSAWLYFQRDLYPILVAPASGDVPTLQEAFGMPRDELDLWYLAVWRLNPEWFTRSFEEESKTETVTFRDGSKVKLVEECGLPSIVLRLLELEDDALLDPSDDADQQIFRLSFYPKMVACVADGDIPSADELRKWPSTESNKWYEAAKRVNPDWFLSLDAISEEAQRAADERAKDQKKSDGMSEAG